MPSPTKTPSRVTQSTPAKDSDDESEDYVANSYTDREMAQFAKISLKPFVGTYDIFEKMDFFKKPDTIEFADPIKFLKIENDEEALEVLEAAMMPL